MLTLTLALTLEATMKTKKSEVTFILLSLRTGRKRGEMYERERFLAWPFFLSSSSSRICLTA